MFIFSCKKMRLLNVLLFFTFISSYNGYASSNNKSGTMASGLNHTLQVKPDGTLWAWGQNISGQLGDGTNNDRNVPVQIGSDNKWIGISAGEYHTIGLKSDGTIWAWGRNIEGQLGDGTNNDRNAPVQILCKISATAGSGGSITPSGNISADYGDSRTFSITVNTGYHIEDVLVDGVPVGPVPAYTFNNINANHTINVNFAVTRAVPSTPAGNIDTIFPGSANRVDGHDLYIFSRGFGSQPGGSNWNSAADLDENNIVDENDLVVLAANFGKKN